MKKSLLLFLVLTFTHLTNGSQLSISLSAEQLETALLDAKSVERIKTLAQLVWLYRNNNFNRSLQYGEEALVLLKIDPQAELQVQVLHSMAWAHMRAGGYDKATRLATEASNIATSAEDNEGLAYALNVLGSVAWYQGDFLTSLDYFLNMLEIRQEIGEKLNIARSYNNIGSVYQEIEDYAHAREYHELSLALMEELNNQYGIATSFFNLGIIHQRLGDEKKQEYYLEHANIAFTEIGDQAALSEVQINLGYFKLKQRKLDVALAFFNLSEISAGNLNNPSLLARAILGQGHVAFLKNDLDRALKLVETALVIVQPLEEQPQLRDAYQLLADIHQANGKFAESLRAYQEFSAVKDKVLNNTYQGRLALLQKKFEKKYEVRQNKSKADLLAKENTFDQQNMRWLYLSLVIFSILIGVIIFLIIKLKSYRVPK